MSTIKALLHCTMAEPYLTKVVESGRYSTVGKKDMRTLGYTTENELSEASLNGTVCFSCDIEKVEKIRHDYSPLGDDLFFTKSVSIPVDFERQTCLNTEQLNSYQPRYALYIENVKEIKPFKIPSLELMKDNVSTSRIPAKSLSRAPQNMCWAWAWNDEERKWERVLVLSLRPKNLCNIANGLKDIETRRQVVNEIKEMEK